MSMIMELKRFAEDEMLINKSKLLRLVQDVTVDYSTELLNHDSLKLTLVVRDIDDGSLIMCVEKVIVCDVHYHHREVRETINSLFEKLIEEKYYKITPSYIAEVINNIAAKYLKIYEDCRCVTGVDIDTKHQLLTATIVAEHPNIPTTQFTPKTIIMSCTLYGVNRKELEELIYDRVKDVVKQIQNYRDGNTTTTQNKKFTIKDALISKKKIYDYLGQKTKQIETELQSTKVLFVFGSSEPDKAIIESIYKYCKDEIEYFRFDEVIDANCTLEDIGVIIDKMTNTYIGLKDGNAKYLTPSYSRNILL